MTTESSVWSQHKVRRANKPTQRTQHGHELCLKKKQRPRIDCGQTQQGWKTQREKFEWMTSASANTCSHFVNNYASWLYATDWKTMPSNYHEQLQVISNKKQRILEWCPFSGGLFKVKVVAVISLRWRLLWGAVISLCWHLLWVFLFPPPPLSLVLLTDWLWGFYAHSVV